MAGRHNNFRQGDRSELLADYLLSGIGITTPIRRQDDTGFDFYCSISDQEKGVLTFGFPYIIQIKSKTSNNIITYGTENQKEWASHQVEWLFRNELPLLFGLVDKATQSIEIYDCSSFYFSRINSKLPALIQFIPRAGDDIQDIRRPEEKDIPNWSRDDSIGKSYKVDIGNPIITLCNNDFDDNETIKSKKKLLREAISIQSITINFSKLKLPYLNWIVNNTTNISLTGGWAFYIIKDSTGTRFVCNNNAEALISIGIHSIVEQNEELISSIKKLLSIISQEKIPVLIKKEFPQLFS